MDNLWHFRTGNSHNYGSKEGKDSIHNSKHDIVIEIISIRMIAIEIPSPFTEPHIKSSVKDHPAKHTEENS